MAAVRKKIFSKQNSRAKEANVYEPKDLQWYLQYGADL